VTVVQDDALREKLYRTGNVHVQSSRRCRFSLAGYQATPFLWLYTEGNACWAKEFQKLALLGCTILITNFRRVAVASVYSRLRSILEATVEPFTAEVGELQVRKLSRAGAQVSNTPTGELPTWGMIGSPGKVGP
jgi:hypothetical protein